MNKKRLIINLRRFSQSLFLFLFLFLLMKTEFRGTFGEGAELKLPYPVKIFLGSDPLVGISTALSTFTLYEGLIFSFVVLFLTFLFGRFFCSWLCPFGTLNNFFSSFKKKRKSDLIKENKPKKSHNLKYYILIFFLISALFSSVFVSILDPIPFLVRSLSVAIIPGFNYFLNGLIHVFSNSEIGALEGIGGVLNTVFSIT